jgi:exopolysaccharide biosynthesis WecB/TagA/CpsF family protein
MSVKRQTDVLPVLRTVSTATTRPWTDAVGGRLLDVVLATVVGVALLPLLLVVALFSVIRRRPVLLRRRRVGQHGREFTLLRFGTGLPCAWLPLTWNVVRGQLSWIGPRPLDAEEAAQLPSTSPRFDVPAGVLSRYALRSKLGIAYESEEADDEEFARSVTFRMRVGLMLRAAVARFLGGRRAWWRLAGPVEFFGVPVNDSSMDDAVDWLVEQAVSGAPTRVGFVNPHCLNLAHGDDGYRAVLSSADRVYADGIGIRLACRLLGAQLSANVNGTDMFPRLTESASKRDLSFFLLGARPGVAAATAAAMQERQPGLHIAGVRDGYFGRDDEAAVIDEINASGADILLVAMGAPKQDLWLAANHERLQVPVRIGVGGLFDFYSGRIRRAPVWVREVGFEWFWRLLQEPGRMWRRYVVGNPVFLWRVWRERVSGGFREAAAVREAASLHNDSPLRQARRQARVHVKRALWYGLTVGSDLSKRLVDIVVAAAVLAALCPIFLLVAVLIRLDSTGPVFFYQIRVGQWGRPFRMYKFRSMYVDAERRRAALQTENQMNGGVIFKMKKDPRITRVGRVMRKLSIDELPQLWHVLTGEMSLVGPRPPLPIEVEQYSLTHRRRLDVKPGITCLWQVSGRSEIPFEKQVELDVAYIESQSLWADLVILFKTIPAVLTGRGAY